MWQRQTVALIAPKSISFSREKTVQSLAVMLHASSLQLGAVEGQYDGKDVLTASWHLWVCLDPFWKAAITVRSREHAQCLTAVTCWRLPNTRGEN